DRDDDYRLSLTQGSFITLSNLSEQEFQRIIAWRLSPLYISVHAWDPETRARLMGCRAAGKLPEQMQRLAAAGLTLHAQIVVLPEMNDGDCLRQTILNLRALYPAVQSIGVVPVGLTQYRQGLTPLRGFTAEEAASILAQGQEWQAAWRAETGRSIVYYADEFYVLAGWDFPPPPIYDDFAQLENGIGMASKFSAEIEAVWPFLPEKVQSRRVHLLTGTSAAGYFHIWAKRLRQRVVGLEPVVHTIVNEFFGATVTAAGLLTAEDIARQTSDLQGEDFLIPQLMLKAGTRIFLDDRDVDWLSGQIQGRAIVVENEGRSFLEGLLGSKLEV
ncbi:MAG: DUF512 domain-containing protein, partial [Peptococcaceae bacterium]|nr:DUF512 domain-containing protein [Peptococcaceae bacterium]